MKVDNEERLRRLFRALHEDPQQLTPSFQEVWRKASILRESRQHTFLWPRFAAVGGTSAIAVLLVAWLYLGPLSPMGVTPQSTGAEFDVATWQSPTAFLLDSPERELFGGFSETGSATDALLDNADNWFI